jgi:hypothetical protein
VNGSDFNAPWSLAIWLRFATIRAARAQGRDPHFLVRGRRTDDPYTMKLAHRAAPALRFALAAPLVLQFAICGIAFPQGAASKPAASKPAASKPAASKPAAAAPETDDEAIALADRLEKIVEETRGLKFKHPVKKGVYDKERLAKFLEQQMKKENAEAQYSWQEKAWKILGLIPPSMDVKGEMKELLLEQIGGFYDPDTKELKVMRGFGGLIGEVLMAHELCHALEDQHFDLNQIDERNKEQTPDDDDRQFAAHSVMEGSATILMQKVMMKRMEEGNLSPNDVMGGLDMSNPAFSGEKARKAPKILVKPLMEMYMSGASFLGRDGGMLGMMNAKEKDIDYAFKHIPLSSEQILHPKKYWNPTNSDLPIVVTIPDLAPDLGKGWKRLGGNVFGEIGVAILTMPKPEPEPEPEPGEEPNPIAEAMKMLREKKTTKESRGWGGDRYELYGGPLDGVLLVWVSAWDTEADAKEMEEWLKGALASGAIGAKKLDTTIQRTETEGLHRVDLISTSEASLMPVALKALKNVKFQALTADAMTVDPPKSRPAKGTGGAESAPAKKDTKKNAKED